MTAYADELIEYDLPEGGFWPESTKAIQRNWIGRSEGVEADFPLDGRDGSIRIFTTRIDTVYGMGYRWQA